MTNPQMILTRRWVQALREFHNAELDFELECAEDAESEAAACAFDRMEQAKEEVLLQHAPDLEAVVRKISLLHGYGLYEDDDDASALRRIITDVRRLGREVRKPASEGREPNEWDEVLENGSLDE